jgi:hypothetical protein
MGWFKTDAEKAEKASIERIKDIRKKMLNITKLGEGAITIEGPKLKRYQDEIDKIKSDNLNSKAIQEAKNINKLLIQNKTQNTIYGNNSVLAGIQKKYVENNKNKQTKSLKSKTFANNSSPTQMDRNKFSNKTKSLKSKTFANNSSPTQMDKNKQTKSLKSKTFANNSSPTQMDRNKFSNKTKSLESKTFASKQKAFNKKYRV